MKILEYQAKSLFKQFDIPIPNGAAMTAADDLAAVIKGLPSPKVVLKAQVPVGGRGKAGGIKLSNDLADAREKAAQIFAMRIKDCPVRCLLVEEQIEIDRELYLSFILDRDSGCYKMIFSPSGGMEIEELAVKEPEKVLIQSITNFPGLMAYQMREVFAMLKDFPPAALRDLNGIARNLYRLFIEKEATLVEINPLVLTKDGRCLACDGKVVFDDNAIGRHKDILELRIPEDEDPYEREAREKNLNYVKLDGTIGCMVNGAGLAMATMDVIKHFGGNPANFLDIGGGAKAQQVREALEIILGDRNVKALFINIFGGIVRCDLVAEGIVAAKKGLNIQCPMVIRLVGTNDKKAYEILAAEGISAFTTMDEAARSVVEAAR